MFDLKIIVDRTPGIDLIVSDNRHDQGGLDTKQEMAFKHLIPCGELDYVWREILYELASLHNWSVTETGSDITLRKDLAWLKAVPDLNKTLKRA